MRIALFLAALLLSGCLAQTPVCDRPYILVGSGCCLDEDADRICDRDKPVTTTQPPTTSTVMAETSTTEAATSTTAPPKPKALAGAVVDVERPDGMVTEVRMLTDSPERYVVGDLHMLAYGRDVLNVVVWDTTTRVEYDNATEKVYVAPDYDRVSPLKLRELTGLSVGDHGLLGGEAYYVYAIKPGRIILAKGRVLDDLAPGNYTSEYGGYKFMLFKLLYDE